MTENVSYRILWLDTKPVFRALIGRRGRDGDFLNVAVETGLTGPGFVHLIPVNILGGDIAAKREIGHSWRPLQGVWDASPPVEQEKIQEIENQLRQRYAPERVDIKVGERWETVVWLGMVLKNMTMTIRLITETELKLEEVDRHGHDRMALAVLCEGQPEDERERFVDAMIDLLRFEEFQCQEALADLLIKVLPGKRWAGRDRKFVHVHDRLAQHVTYALIGTRTRDRFLTEERFPRFNEYEERSLRKHFAELRGPQIYRPPLPPPPVTPVTPIPVGPNVRLGWTVNFPFNDLVRTCLRGSVARTLADVPPDTAAMTCQVDGDQYDFVCGRAGRELSAFHVAPFSIVMRAGPSGTGRSQIRLFGCRVVLVKPDGQLLPAGTVEPRGAAPTVVYSENVSLIELQVQKSRFTSDLALAVAGAFKPLRKASESQVFAIAGLGESRSGACLLLRGSPPDKYILRAIVLFEYSLGIARR